ncbi:GNAT family N-acetyltransferase [Actinospica robiniae]|uniref:GNAT family N-acetyltransferase n=1 Tax=Actinospica robiniae TaxID=304901 RepID=UPI0012F97CB0|nr:GNAT family N-acetyltransferase [Actinospica robiniae]
MDLSWRTLTRLDAPAMSDVHRAAAIADGTSDLRSSADMAEIFRRESIGEVKRRYFGAFDGDDALAAFSILFARTGLMPQHQLQLWGAVDPRHRRAGIGGELVRRAVQAAPGLHAEVFPGAPLEIAFLTADGVDGQAKLAAEAGFTPSRRHLRMAKDLPRDTLPARPSVSPGLELRRFHPADEHDLLATHLEAFIADHPGFTPPTPLMWSRRLTALSFLPDLSFLIRDPAQGRIAGYVLSNSVPSRPDRPDRREVQLTTIATRREYRRRGVASALIAAVLRTAAELEYDGAALNVDARNPTGALSVYEHAGFSVGNGTTLYVKQIPI